MFIERKHARGGRTIDAPPARRDRLLCVSVHDVAPATWSRCRRVLAAIEEVDAVALSLLVVPAYRGLPAAGNDAFEAWLARRRAAGDELLLHGYTHVDDGTVRGPADWIRRRFYTAGEGEFSSISYTQAQLRLQRGKQWFAANGWPLHGFVAPAWLLSSGAWAALQSDRQLAYTTTLHHIVQLPHRRRIPAPCLVYSNRSAWRRRASRAWNALLIRAIREQPIVRLALHPDDADDPDLRASWQDLLRRLLAERQAMTKWRALSRYAQRADNPSDLACQRKPN